MSIDKAAALVLRDFGVDDSITTKCVTKKQTKKLLRENCVK
jgi:hypothetical protein